MTMNSDIFDQGAKAYKDGVDVLNVPSYLTDKEREMWIVGYDTAMYRNTISTYHEGTVEVEELDFQS